jgi:N-acetyl-anhydromuramyl-L-alanine amidase AmpD
MIAIEEHVLKGAKQLDTPNFTKGFQVKPMYLIFYKYGGDDEDVFLSDDVCQKRSLHLLIDRTGAVSQLCPFTTKAWHAGQSYWQGHHGLNSFAIGIGLRIDKMLDGYSDPQLVALDKIVPALVVEYNIRDVMTHGQVSSSQAYDPGPLFPLDRYKPYVEYGNAESAGKYVVAVTDEQSLNVRGGPDVQFSVIDKLKTGETVKVLRSTAHWLFCSYQRSGEARYRQGWVHEAFLRRA